MTEADIEQALQAIAASNFADVLRTMQDAPPSPYFMRAYLNGMLSAVAAYLVRELGPREAYGTFQRLADECAAETLQH